MSYTVDSKTKYATYNSVAYGPIASIKDGVTTLVALSEDDCKEMEARKNAKPARDLEALRKKRNSKLAKTDWMSNSDAPTMSTAWKNYRQALRDITKTYASQMDAGFKWPDEPS